MHAHAAEQHAPGGGSGHSRPRLDAPCVHGARSRPAASSAGKPDGPTRARRAAQVSTREVWPWSVLVPWLEDDLRARAAAAPAGVELPAHADPYDCPAVAMPLAEFLEAPLVRDLVHNGSALQVGRAPKRAARL